MKSTRLLLTSLLLLMLSLGITQVKAQTTTTRFNDGYLTVFRQSAPTGSSFTLSGTTANSSTTVTMASTSGIAVGMSVTGGNIAANTSVSSIVVNTSITLSVATSATGGGTATLTFNGALNTAGTAIYLDEYHPSNTSQSAPNYTVTFPSSGSTGIVAGATTSSNGAISRSENGRYILVPGFSTGTGGAALGSANTTNSLCAVRPTNGSGTIGTGITGASNWFTAANDYRGAASDDLSNYWLSGGTLGVRTTTNGTTLTTVSATTTNVRAVNIFNGQLYYSTGSGTNGVYQVGLGKPITTGQTGVNLTTSTGAYGFSISPDFLTLYTLSGTGTVSRWTYSGSYNTTTGVYSGGSWSAASTGFALAAVAGVAVDWSGYSFSTSANGAVVYACNTTTLVKGNDNGTGAITTSTLATLTGLNTFKQLAFSPIKQTVSLYSGSPATGNLTANTTDNTLFAFQLSADEGNSTMKKVIVHQNGTAVLGTDITSIRLVYDADGSGTINGTELTTNATTGTVSGLDVTFSIASPTYISQGNTGNYFVVGNVSSTATVNATLIPTIVSNKSLNSTNYTTNLVNAGGSWVNMGTTVPTGNTLTILGPTPTIVLSSFSQIGAGNLTQGSVDQPVSNFQAAITVAAATLNTLTFTIGNGGGTYSTGDVTNFKLWYNASSNTFSGASQIGSTFNSTATASGGTITFSSLGQAISSGVTGNFWITASINGSAVPNDKFNVSIPTLTFASGTPTNNITAGGAQTILLLTPTISLANGTINAATITENSINNVLYRADVSVLTTNAILNTAAFVTTGTYAATDLTNFKLWYSTSSTFSAGTSTLLGTLTNSLGAGTSTFTSLSQTFSNGTTAYLYLTTDLPCGSFNGNTISVNAITTTSLTFASGTPTGSGFTAGGLQTISSTTNNATGFAATNGNAISVATWTAPTGCYNEIMVVVAPAANTGTPTGNGSAYTGNLTYTSGTGLGNGFVVYKGTTSSQTITGLLNGSTYYVKIFTRNGTNWSSGVEVSITPVAPHFTAGNLAVEVVGTGTGSLSGTATAVSIREYTTTGTLANTFTQPNATTGSLPTTAPFYVTESGSATSAGQLNRSADGSKLLFPGYNALVGQTSVVATTTPTNKRVLGIAYQDGSNTNNAFDFFSGNNFRSIASNGYSYWAVGTITGGAGLFYLKDLTSTPVSLGSVNTRVAKIFNNTLYYSTATTSAAGIFQVAPNGLPLSVSDVSLVRLTDATYANTVANSSSPYAFEINPAGNVMYIGDDNGTFVNSTTQKGGIIKYIKTGSTWSFAYTLQSPVAATSSGIRGLVVDWTTTNPTIYFTSSSSNNNVIAKLVDAGSGSTGSVIVTAVGTSYALRGIAFSPVTVTTPQITCTANLLAFGGEPVGYASAEKSFNIAGVNYSGGLTVSIPVTSPAGQYGLSLTPGGPYTSSVTLTSAPSNTTVYMVLQPDTVGTFNGNLTIADAASTSITVPVTGKGIIPVNYYNTAGTDVTQLNNWWTNTNGTGSNPTDFTTDGQYFNIINAPLSLAASATTANIDQLATTASGSPVLSFTGVPTCANSPQSLVVGATISGNGIPSGTTISSITANTITMSANCTITDNVGTTIAIGVSGPWTITGSLSKIIVANGINFTIPSTRSYAGVADVAANGTLTLQTNTLPTFGTLDVASTVNYNQSGTASVVAATYGNLTLQGTALDARVLPISGNVAFDLKVMGNFTADNVTVLGQTVSPYTFMKLGGNYTMTNNAVMVAATPTSNAAMISVVTTGNNTQTFTYTNSTIRLLTLNSTKSSGGIKVAANTTLLLNGNQTPSTTYGGMNLNFSGTAKFATQTSAALKATGVANINLNFTDTSTFTLSGDLNASDNSSSSFGTTPTCSLIANFATGTSFIDGGNTITVAGNLGLGGAASAYNLTGNTVIATRTGTSTIGDDALTNEIVPTLSNFTFAPIAGSSTTFAGSGNVNIAGDFTIGGSATANKISAGADTIIIKGNYNDTRTADMVSAGTATWKFNGTSAQTFSTAYTSGESFNSVALNNAAGLTMATGDIKIGAAGKLTCNSGVLTTGSNKVILNATGSIIESSASYVLGNVTSTRTLTAASNNFGGLGFTVSAASAPGSTTVLRNTGTSNSIGCASASILRTYTVTNSGSALNANLQMSFDTINELNSLPMNYLKLFNVTANTPIAGASLTGNLFTINGLATIAGTYSGAINQPPSITTQPSNTASICAFSAANFSVIAAGYAPSGLSYAWSVKIPPATTFTPITSSSVIGAGTTVFSNIGTNTLGLTNFPFSMNGAQFICTVSGSCTPSATTTTATLNLLPVPTANILGTSNQSIIVGNSANITLNVTGSPSISGVLTGGLTNINFGPFSGTGNQTITIPANQLTTTRTITVSSLSDATCSVNNSSVLTGAAVIDVYAVNDECLTATALPITVNCQPQAATSFNGHASSPATGCSGTPVKDVWFEVFKPAGLSTLSISVQTASGNNNYDPDFEVLYGSCGTLSSVSCATSTSLSGESKQVQGLPTTQGNYYIRVYDKGGAWGTGAHAGDFTICVYGSVPPPANDDPCAASNASSNQGYVGNQPLGNLFSYDNGANCFSGVADNSTSTPPTAPNLVYYKGTTSFSSNNFSTWEPAPTCGVSTNAKTIWLKFKAPTINEADVEIRTDYTTTSPAGNTWILAAYRLTGGTACFNPVFTRLLQNGSIPYCSSNGVLHINGSDLVNYAGSDIYLQVMAPNGGGGTYMVSVHGIITNPLTSSSAVTTTTIPVSYGTIGCQSNNLLKYLFWRPTGTNGYSYTGVAGNATNYLIQGLASGVTYDIWSLYRDGYTGSALYEKYLQNNTETGCSGGIAPTAPAVTPQYQGHCSKALVNISIGATNPAVGHLISNFPYRLYWQKAGTSGYSVVALQSLTSSIAQPYVVGGLLSPYSYNFWYVAICNGGAQVRSGTTTTPTCSGAPRTGKDEAVYEVNGVYFVNQPMSEVAAYYEATHEVPMDGNEHHIDIHQVEMPNAMTDMQSTTQTESETSHALTGSFNLLPNPTTDRVKVEYNLPSENLTTATIKLMDMAGRIIRTINIDKPSKEGYVSMDLADLNSGIYLVNITTEGYTETKKLVVSK